MKYRDLYGLAIWRRASKQAVVQQITKLGFGQLSSQSPTGEMVQGLLLARGRTGRRYCNTLPIKDHQTGLVSRPRAWLHVRHGD